jgi:hypothetical protein
MSVVLFLLACFAPWPAVALTASVAVRLEAVAYGLPGLVSPQTAFLEAAPRCLGCLQLLGTWVEFLMP